MRGAVAIMLLVIFIILSVAFYGYMTGRWDEMRLCNC